MSLISKIGAGLPVLLALAGLGRAQNDDARTHI